MSHSEFFALRERIRKEGHKCLSDEQHAELIECTKAGDKRAETLLITAHERFIYFYLGGKHVSTVDTEETMQECRLVIQKAASMHDPKKGSFTTYLGWWIRHAKRLPNSGDSIIAIAYRQLQEDGKTRRHRDEAQIALNVVSMQEKPFESAGHTFEDEIVSDIDDPETAFAAAETDRALNAIIESNILSERDRAILRSRIFDELTLQNIGDTFGLTRERIRCIEAEVLTKIRKEIQKKEQEERCPRKQ